MPERPRPESSPVQVALLGSFPPQRQGIPRYCGDLARALARVCRVSALGYKAMYPAFLFPGDTQRWDNTQELNNGPDRLQVSHRIRWYNPLSWFLAACTSCDVAHVQWWSLPLFPICWLFARVMRWRGKPVLVTVHNVLPHESSRWFCWAGERLCRLADGVIVHGAASKAQLAESYRIPEERIEVIPMAPADITPLSRETYAQQAARRTLRLPENGSILLFAGTIRPYKGLHLLLEAFAMSLKDLGELNLVIAGKPWDAWAPYEAQIARLAIEDRVCSRLAFIPENEWPLYFQAADAVILPYTHLSGQSHIAAWALACDLPLLVSQAGSLSEWVNGLDHVVFPAEDIPAIQQTITGFFMAQTQRTQDFSEHAKRLRKQRAWPEIARQHRSLYHRVLHEKAPK